MEEVVFGIQPVIKMEKTPVIEKFEELLERSKEICSKEISITDKETRDYAKSYAEKCNKVKDFFFNERKKYKAALFGDYEDNSMVLEKMFKAKGEELNKLVRAWDKEQKEKDASVVNAPAKPEQPLYTLTLTSYNKEKLLEVLKAVKVFVNDEVALTTNLEGEIK